MSRVVLTALHGLIATLGAISVASADTGRALLDLATCHGSTLPAAALDGEGEGADRLADIARVFDELSDPDRFAPSDEYPGFWAPTDGTEVVGFAVQYLGLSGYGIFEGPSLVLLGAFDEVRGALADEASVDYGDCRADGLLKVCTKEVASNQSRLVMSHPTDPAERTVLVCVENAKELRE